jgi:hypothetical protein
MTACYLFYLKLFFSLRHNHIFEADIVFRSFEQRSIPRNISVQLSLSCRADLLDHNFDFSLLIAALFDRSPLHPFHKFALRFTFG